MSKLESDIMDFMAEFYSDPLGHVMASYPWDTENQIRVVPLEEPWRSIYQSEYGPDAWACEFLTWLGEEIEARNFDGSNKVLPIRAATVSGHGIGKSTMAAWLIKFLMDTRPLAVGTVTAVTDAQLQARTWAELMYWHKMSMTADLFATSGSKGAMKMWSLVDGGQWAEKWKIEAKTCRPEKSEGFAGQHSPTSTSFYILDEASGIDNKIYEVLEGGLSDGEPMVFLFGNGTRNSGEFYDACTSPGTKYKVRSIDSRTVHITNKEKIEEDRQQWVGGEDGDRFRARWRGLFPKKGNQQFIGGSIMEQAGSRALPNIEHAEPMVLGMDVARFGDDDTVIWPRRGRDARTWEPATSQGMDTDQCVQFFIKTYNFYLHTLGIPVVAAFIDEGYNPGVLDNLRNLGYPVHGVNFGNSATDMTTYRYRVDEMWGRLRDELAKSLCVPARTKAAYAERLHADLTQREYGFTLAGQIRLESKAELKKRGLPSPDYADALALTYAVDIDGISVRESLRSEKYEEKWHPHDELKGVD